MHIKFRLTLRVIAYLLVSLVIFGVFVRTRIWAIESVSSIDIFYWDCNSSPQRVGYQIIATGNTADSSNYQVPQGADLLSFRMIDGAGVQILWDTYGVELGIQNRVNSFPSIGLDANVTQNPIRFEVYEATRHGDFQNLIISKTFESPCVPSSGNAQPTAVSPTNPPPQSVSCRVDSLDILPTNGDPGTSFAISARGSCNTGVRAIRFKVNGNVFYELGASSVVASWNSTGATPGTYTATVEVAGWGDDAWLSAASASRQFTVGNLSPTEISQPSSCTISSLNVSPPNGNAGTVFTISGNGSCSTGVRAMRVKVDGAIIYELGSSNISATWNSSGVVLGIHTGSIEVAGIGDNAWIYSASSSQQFGVGVVAPGNTLAPMSSPIPPATPLPTPQNPVCHIDSFSVSPASGMPGTVFTFAGSGSCPRGVRAVRFLLNGVPLNELGAPFLQSSWNSTNYSLGTHSIGFQVAQIGTTDWTQAVTSYRSVILGNQLNPTSSPVSSGGAVNNGSPTIDCGSSAPAWQSNLHIIATGNVNVRQTPGGLSLGVHVRMHTLK